MKRRHRMPFGAELQSDGAVRFRLWAPTAEKVLLTLEGQEVAELPMENIGDGWFSCITKQAQAGTRYRYRIDDRLSVPDPASRFNPDDVHGPSEVIDSAAFEWNDESWKGRPWEEVVIYELHVGTFTSCGNYEEIEKHLDHLRDLGITAIELMPLSDFPGARNWGYDGVLPFAPDSSYGRPENLKRLIQSAHHRGLMVFLDVVYNHFGPEGNYLHSYAESFFSKHHHTPWGAAINYDEAGARAVRDFAIHNALYWLEEYHFDGLRLDAVQAILDDSDKHLLIELAEAVRQGPGADRHVHLTLENDDNAAKYLERSGTQARWYDAQWNDDFHHAMHVVTTEDTSGYYGDYAKQPVAVLARSLTEGFIYQGQVSQRRVNEKLQGLSATHANDCSTHRGESSVHLAPMAFVNFLDNHDQVANRPLGDRVAHLMPAERLRAATAILLLAPSVPMLFMGQEWAAPMPFVFFCDFGAELRAVVCEGRRNEFARFEEYRDKAAREKIPDTGDPTTFASTVLDWSHREKEMHSEWLEFHRKLLQIRHDEIVPRLAGMRGHQPAPRMYGERAFAIEWELGDRSRLMLIANLGDEPLAVGAPLPDAEHHLLSIPQTGDTGSQQNALPPWGVVVALVPAERL